MNVLQLVVTEMNRQAQEDRSKTQMTLGQLIAILKHIPDGAQVPNLGNPHSYRGYYCDLALELKPGTRDVAELRRECIEANGETFEGYKGGDYTMSLRTPVWVADYGCCGSKLMAFGVDGIETEEEP